MLKRQFSHRLSTCIQGDTVEALDMSSPEYFSVCAGTDTAVLVSKEKKEEHKSKFTEGIKNIVK